MPSLLPPGWFSRDGLGRGCLDLGPDSSTEQIRTVDQMRTFVEGAELAEIGHVDLDGAYTLIGRTLERVLCPCLGKADKGVVKRFLEKATGLSRAQITRLVGQHRRTGGLRDHRKKPPARPFSRRYTPRDAAMKKRNSIQASTSNAVPVVTTPTPRTASSRSSWSSGRSRSDHFHSAGHSFGRSEERIACWGTS